jgi:hypothetical protein
MTIGRFARWVATLTLPSVIACGAFVAAGGLTPVSAQQAITVISEAPRNEFPAGVTFSISFTAPTAEKEVRFRYELAPDGTGASGIAGCDGAGTVNCTFTLQSGRGLFVIPGAEITYHWEIEDQQGTKLSTPEKIYVHEDTRFDFRTIDEGNVTVYFHAATEGAAGGVLVAAVETLAAIGALEGAQVTFPVKVFVYETADQMQPAIAPGGGRGVQILGEVVYSDTAMVSADVATLDIARHEVAHIVTREATRGPYGVPDWMNEGISVYAQRQPLSGHDDALQAAIRNDRVLSMNELSSSATGGVASTVGLYYGQAGAIVTFLVDEYGAVKFAELITTFTDGTTPDDAFKRIYGFDSLGLENAWRASVGLDARAASPPATPQPTGEARAEPTARPGDTPSGAGSSSGDGAPVIGIALIIVLALAAAGAGAIALRVVRERL